MLWPNSGDNMKATLLNSMGDDNTVVDAARVSFKKGHKEFTEAQNHKLIKYLADHGHYSPFGHCFASFHVKAPIFVARQLFKHEYLRANEVSRRYVSDRPEFYLPDKWRMKSENVKQGSTKEPLIIDGVRHCKYCSTKLEFMRKEDESMKVFCSSKCQGHYYRKHTDRGWATAKHSSLRESATKRGIYFNLTIDDLIELGRPLKCPYLEVELDYAATELKANSPSVNRIDATKGYIKGNLEICSNKANSMLLNATKDELKTFIKNVSVQHFGMFTDTSHSVEDYYEKCADAYEASIAGGLCPEQARMFLPVTQMTEWYWSGSLDAFANMANLRCKPDTQEETRLIANQISEQMLEKFPVSWTELTKWK